MFNTKVLHGMNENEEAFNTTVVLKTKVCAKLHTVEEYNEL